MCCVQLSVEPPDLFHCQLGPQSFVLFCYKNTINLRLKSELTPDVERSWCERKPRIVIGCTLSAGLFPLESDGAH
jgi:hypothetical protein